MIEVRADQRTFTAVADALAAEAGGRQLRHDLAEEILDGLVPVVAEVRGRLMASGGGGLPHEGPPLRAAIAAGVHVDARISATTAGARIRATRRGLPRDFVNAPKRFNQRHFRRRVYGGRTVVWQVGAPGWFDGPTSGHEEKYRRAVLRAMDRCVRRITRRV